MINILLTSAGRRGYLVEYFVDALAGRGRVIAANSDTSAPALAAADQIANNHNTGGNPDAGRKRRAVRGLGLLHAVDDCQPSPHGPLSRLRCASRMESSSPW